MYVPSHHFTEEPEQEIVCLFTDEKFVYLEGDKKSLIHPKHAEGAVDELPPRFYKQPFIKRYPNGQVRVFGSIE